MIGHKEISYNKKTALTYTCIIYRKVIKTMFFFYHKAKKPNRKNYICFLLTLAVTVGCFFGNTATAYATLEELEAESEARRLLPIQSNEIENWPVGPKTSAQSAILMDADTGVILYAKNIHEKLYPASTTKILTCLLAMERGNLDDMVTFSHDAVFSVPADGSNMGMDAGQSITLEQCLYGILVGSANEVANAVAEYISGSMSDFVDLMNERAAELGCKDSHFMNANGLYDDNHYTSVYDLATISRYFFQNEMLCKIGNTARYHFEATATQPDDFYLNNKHKLINGEIPYEGVLGGKTGYTGEARQTLVTCAEQNGMKLICIVFKEESPNQFADTVELLNYGFQNFQIMNISENEDKYNIEATGFLQTGNDIFGSSEPILSVDTDSYVIMPNTISFSDLDSEIQYDIEDENRVAQINYSYNDTYVGCAYVELATVHSAAYDFDTNLTATEVSVEKVDPEPSNDTIFINVKKVLTIILITAAVLILLFIIRALMVNNRNARRRQNRIKRKKRRRERVHSEFSDFDF